MNNFIVVFVDGVTCNEVTELIQSDKTSRELFDSLYASMQPTDDSEPRLSLLAVTQVSLCNTTLTSCLREAVDNGETMSENEDQYFEDSYFFGKESCLLKHLNSTYPTPYDSL
jgi:hypothetical protein